MIIVNGKQTFLPREYQLPFLRSMDNGARGAILLWHRKSGKSLFLMNWAMREMATTNEPLLVWHVFPTYNEAKKTVWDGKDNFGKSFLSYWPENLIKNKNETDMTIELWNGSVYQLIGSDNYDKLRGPNPRLVILDEYSCQDPNAYELVVDPIVTANNGRVIFAFTPQGRNHAFEKYKTYEKDPKWFVQKLTIDDTFDEYGKPLVTLEQINEKRAKGKLESHIQQEFYCSFEGSVDGAYYTIQLQQARREGRIGSVPYDSRLPVYTFWDLGYSDYMSIWFVQRINNQFRIIDFYQNRQHGLDHYAKVLKDLPYNYREHYLPHDVAVHELGTGKSRLQIAEDLGIKPILRVERPNDNKALMAGIEAVRAILSQCYFDEVKCNKYRGLASLEAYHAAYNAQKEILYDSPVHDWSSHPSDAFRTFATCQFVASVQEEDGWNGLKSKGTWSYAHT